MTGSDANRQVVRRRTSETNPTMGVNLLVGGCDGERMGNP